jgi:hypothetical protein
MSHPVEALARALVAMAIAVTLVGAFRAEAQSLGLPEVTVTAPPITPQWKKWSPYSSNPRVQEEKWPEIPCNSRTIWFSPIPATS